jgi:alkyl hydroperoxide reductase subunit AhpC
MLADPAHRVADAYGVYNLTGDGLAAPAVFVIDTDGRILWSYVGQHPGDRPSVQMMRRCPAGEDALNPKTAQPSQEFPHLNGQ